MKPSLIKAGKSYRNKGKGRTVRRVLEISKDLRPPWYSSAPRPDDLVVRYEQDGKESTLYLRSFAAWAGAVCDD